MAPPVMPDNPGPFYFAWVLETETIFAYEHHVEDELIYSAKVTHAEGQTALLEIEIRNPGVGLLSAGRKRWAWFSWYDPDEDTVKPLFFGQVVGLPSDLFGETVILQLVAKPKDYGLQKRALAEAMKVAPYWDSLAFRPEDTDDPDKVLDGYTKLWHCDRVTHEVTASDEITGEDGTETFTGDDLYYQSVTLTHDQTPLKAVRMEADVGWTQVYTGSIDMHSRTFDTLTSRGFTNNWPKPGANVGEGWTVAASGVANQTADTSTVTWTYSWRNGDKTHVIGDTMSVNISWTLPEGTVPISAISGGYLISEEVTPGRVDPNVVDGFGDPAPVNIPFRYHNSMLYVLDDTITGQLTLRYDARRERIERVSFLLESEIQDVITASPDESGEVITISGNNVDKPILNLHSWVIFRGQPVALDQFIFPTNPRLPGAKTIQICTTAGIAGMTEPDFSEIQGETTADGSVVWTSLGLTNFEITQAQTWTPLTEKAIGALLLPENFFVLTWQQITQEGRLNKSPQGANVSEGTIIKTTNGSYQQCSFGGTTGYAEPNFSKIWGALTIDNTAQWKSLGTALPTGSNYYVCFDPGETGEILPPFGAATSVGDEVVDGSVTWRCLAVGEIPIGGSVGMIPNATFFPSDRGLRFLEYLICVASAHLLRSARIVKAEADCSWSRAIELTGRENAVLQDPRFPGGAVGGKVIQYQFSVDGGSGEQIGHITVGSCIGKGTTIEEVAGEPVYAEEDVLEYDVQQHTGSRVLVPIVENVGYDPPVTGDVDDGLRFPLTAEQAIVHEQIYGNITAQQLAVQKAVASAKASASGGGALDLANPVESQIRKFMSGASTAANAAKVELGKVPMSYEMELAPVVNGPFEEVYSVKMTKLAVPKQIDMEAA